MPRTAKKKLFFPPAAPTFTPSQNASNLTLLLLIIVSLFSLYLYFKVRSLEQKITAGATAALAQQPASPLSTDNLKKYAKDLGLNTGKFNTCLDSGSKKNVVTADQKYGSTVGIQGTPGFLVNGKFLGGAFPFDFFKEIIDKEIAGTATNDCSGYSDQLKKYCEVRKNNAFSDPQYAFDPASQSVDTGKSPLKGAVNPKVTIVEFSDFQCPYCVRAYPTMQQILKTYGNQVRFYYKQFPLTQIHPQAQKAAEASLCAYEQGKFWQYHDKLFDIQSQ